MKPIDQLFPHDPEKGVFGDCFRASLASLLELPAERVPHFLHDGCDTQIFCKRIADYLAMHDLCMIEYDAYDIQKYLAEISVGDLFHLISGPSPRFPDCWHTVVGRNGEIVFDPHPTRAGLAGTERTFGLLVALNTRALA